MNHDITKISAKVSLTDIFGPKIILNPRPPFGSCEWLPKSPAIQDFLTGPALAIAGDLPVICSDCVSTKEVLHLLEQANLAAALNIHVYRTERDYQNLLQSLKRQKKKVAFNHVHPNREVDRGLYWVDPQLVSRLNNKGNLPEIVPSGFVPTRVTVSHREAKDVINDLAGLPLVLKAAADQPTAGGYDVIICRSRSDIEDACSYFYKCEKVVVEEFIEIDKIFNTQFAATVNGQIVYLGTSEQISSPSGSYLGNWILKNPEHPKIVEELGRSIMTSAYRLGYWGIGGFDIAVSRDNRILVLDLNFRLNGSTPALLLQDSIMRSLDASVLLSRTWNANIKWDRFFGVCSEFIECKFLIPTSIYNSPSSPYPGSITVFSGILAGASKQDVLKKESLLAQSGLT